MGETRRPYDLDVAPGVHLVRHAYTNCFVIEGDDGITLIDAGYPSTWPRVEACLRAISRSPQDIAGLILTHGHFDHVGFAASVRQRFGVRVWAHEGDRHLAG